MSKKIKIAKIIRKLMKQQPAPSLAPSVAPQFIATYHGLSDAQVSRRIDPLRTIY